MRHSQQSGAGIGFNRHFRRVLRAAGCCNTTCQRDCRHQRRPSRVGRQSKLASQWLPDGDGQQSGDDDQACDQKSRGQAKGKKSERDEEYKDGDDADIQPIQKRLFELLNMGLEEEREPQACSNVEIAKTVTNVRGRGENENIANQPNDSYQKNSASDPLNKYQLTCRGNVMLEKQMKSV